MPTKAQIQIPKTKDDKEFEKIVCDCVNADRKLIGVQENESTVFRLYGRKGQEQNGIDIISDDFTVGIQCKRYLTDNCDRLLREVHKDYKKAANYFDGSNERGKLKCFVAATTMDIDKKVQDKLFGLKEINDCEIKVLFWDDIEEIILMNTELLNKYYPQFTGLTSPKWLKIFADTIQRDRNAYCGVRGEEIDSNLFLRGNTADSNGEGQEDILQPLEDFISHSWKQKQYRHIYIEGEGGIGKTVFLLNFGTGNYNIPSIYVPLYELSDTNEHDLLEDYIHNKFKTRESSATGQVISEIDRLVNAPWGDCPQLLLLLDGLNEVDDQKVRNALIRSIRRLSDKPGVQIITTSRQIYSVLDDFCCFKVAELDKKTQIVPYLESRNIILPSINSNIWDVIKTPLLLQMYADMDGIKKSSPHDFIPWNEEKNAGCLLFNYILCDVDKSLKTFDRKRKNDVVLALLLFAPYYCWKMILKEKDDYVMTESEMRKWTEEYLELLKKQYASEILPWQELIDEIDEVYQLDYDLFTDEKRKCSTIRRILNVFLRVLVTVDKNEHEKKYRVFHQNFRDLFAALHIKNRIDSFMCERCSFVPEELAVLNNLYVIRYLGDILNDEEMNWLWETHKKEGHDANKTYRLLDLICLRNEYNLNNVDFSGMDLSDINLFRYRKPNTCNVLLSNKKENFKNTLLGNKTITEEGHIGLITCLAATENGNRLISGSADGGVRVWNLQTGDCIHTFDYALNGEGHIDEITGIANIENGRYIVSCSVDHTVRMWDGEQGILKWTRAHRYPVMCVSFVPEKSLVASGGYDGTIKIWDVDTGNEVKTLNNRNKEPVTALACTADGALLIAGYYDGQIAIYKLYDLDSPAIFRTHQDIIRTIVLNKDGKSAFSASEDSTICMWDLDRLELKKVLAEHTGPIKCLRINWNDEREMFVSVSSDKSIILWNSRTGAMIRKFAYQGGTITDFQILPDGHYAVSASCDHSLCLWNLDEGIPEILDKQSLSVNNLLIDQRGRYMICGLGDGTIKAWNIKEKKYEWISGAGKSDASRVAITKNGKLGVSGSSDGVIRVWDFEHNVCRQVLQGHRARVSCIIFTSDEKRIISGSYDRSIRIWDIKTGKCKKLLTGHTGIINSIAINKDDNMLISASADCTVKIWDINSGKLLATASEHESQVLDVAVTNKDEIISCSMDKTVKLWDTAGNLIHSFKQHSMPVRRVIVNSNGIAVSASDDQTICIWDINARKFVKQIEAHNDGIGVLNQTQDDSVFITGGFDHMVKIWNLNDLSSPIVLKHDIERMNHLSVIQYAIYDSVRKKAYTGSWDQTVKIWAIKNMHAELLSTKETGAGGANDCQLAPETGKVCIGLGDGLLLIDGEKSDEITIMPADVVGLNFKEARFVTEELKKKYKDNGALLDE